MYMCVRLKSSDVLQLQHTPLPAAAPSHALYSKQKFSSSIWFCMHSQVEAVTG